MLSGEKGLRDNRTRSRSPIPRVAVLIAWHRAGAVSGSHRGESGSTNPDDSRHTATRS